MGKTHLLKEYAKDISDRHNLAVYLKDLSLEKKKRENCGELL